MINRITNVTIITARNRARTVTNTSIVPAVIRLLSLLLLALY